MNNFNNITGTDLVTNKTVTSLKSTQYQRYLIQRDYLQNYKIFNACYAQKSGHKSESANQNPLQENNIRNTTL